MDVTDLSTLYISELQEARSFEDEIASAYDRLAQKASDPDLRNLLKQDADESRHHGDAIADLLARHGAEANRHTDQTMTAILFESARWIDKIDGGTARDAALVATAQRVQHYEIAVYGSLAAWAEAQGLEETGTLEAILEEEKQADHRLTSLAKARLNAAAAA